MPQRKRRRATQADPRQLAWSMKNALVLQFYRWKLTWKKLLAVGNIPYKLFGCSIHSSWIMMHGCFFQKTKQIGNQSLRQWNALRRLVKWLTLNHSIPIKIVWYVYSDFKSITFNIYRKWLLWNHDICRTIYIVVEWFKIKNNFIFSSFFDKYVVNSNQLLKVYFLRIVTNKKIIVQLSPDAMQRFEAPTTSTESRSRSRSRPQSESDSYSTSVSDESESDESEGPQKQPQLANLLVSQLTAFHEEPGKETKPDTLAAKNGAASRRLKNVLKRPCKCAMQCTSRLSFRVAFAAVKLFWSMSKVAQDSLLWSLQQCQRKATSESEFLGKMTLNQRWHY